MSDTEVRLPVGSTSWEARASTHGPSVVVGERGGLVDALHFTLISEVTNTAAADVFSCVGARQVLSSLLLDVWRFHYLTHRIKTPDVVPMPCLVHPPSLLDVGIVEATTNGDLPKVGFATVSMI